ncbi:MAG: B12-binding domain-containing radical SAM protein [Candidatus Eremiobacteraeota bacterium]|nr:B12-binding domain-containing radical SAM protein [Candidatus Eremiobacteraeota bacterium]
MMDDEKWKVDLVSPFPLPPSPFDITLVNIVFPTDIGTKKYYYVPVGVLSLASFLEENGFSAEVLDYQHAVHPQLDKPESYYEFLLKAKSDIIGISVMAKDMPGVIIACQMLKKKYPHKIIILGGPGPTGVARKLMEEFPFIDFVVRGEGEYTLLELMRTVCRKSEDRKWMMENGEWMTENGSPFPRPFSHFPYGGDVPVPINTDNDTESDIFKNIKGLIYRKGSNVKVNPQRERIENINNLPLPAYHLINPNKYNLVYFPSTRGCRHFCTFCDQPALWQGKEISKSPDSVFNEIDYITRELNAKWEVAFSDNEFCADEERFVEFCRRYKDGGYRFHFSMDRRIDSVDEDFLKAARSVNCRLTLYGVESGSDRVLKEIRKGFKSENIKSSLLLSAKYMDNTIASFMFNYPFEELRDFIATLNIIYSLWHKPTRNFITFQLHYLSPLPRTPIFEKYRDTLVRRDVSNMMISGQNETQYEQVIDYEKNKVAVLAKVLTEDGEQRADPASHFPLPISSIVDKYPDIFVPYYTYKSPDLDVKEHLIKCLYVALEIDLQNVLFRYGDNFIYFGQEEIKFEGKFEEERADTVYFKLTRNFFDKPERLLNFLKSKGNEKYILFSVDLEGVPEDRDTGDKLCQFLEDLRMEGFKFKLLSHIPRKYFRFTRYLKMESQFNMPVDPISAHDFFYVDEKGRVCTFDGNKLDYVWEYESREEIQQAIDENENREEDKIKEIRKKDTCSEK